MKHKELAIPTRAFWQSICAALTSVFCGQIFAQAGIDVGSVTGTVKDPTGAVVQKAIARRPTRITAPPRRP